MERTAANPWDWSIKLGYNQAEIIDGATRQVICAGQTAVDGNGHPQHPGDMRAQIDLALDNLEAVLEAAACQDERQVSIRVSGSVTKSTTKEDHCFVQEVAVIGLCVLQPNQKP